VVFGPYLDIVLDDHAADLDDLQHAARTRRIAETVLPDPRAVVNNDIVSNQCGLNRRASGNRAVPSYPDTLTDHRARTNMTAAADFHASTDYRHRVDHDARFQSGRGIDKSCRRHAFGSNRHTQRTKGLWMQQGARHGKCRMRGRCQKHRDMIGDQVPQRLVAKNSRSLTGFQFLTILARQDIANIALFRPIDGRNRTNDAVGDIAVLDLRSNLASQRCEAYAFMGRKKILVLHKQ